MPGAQHRRQGRAHHGPASVRALHGREKSADDDRLARRHARMGHHAYEGRSGVGAGRRRHGIDPVHGVRWRRHHHGVVGDFPAPDHSCTDHDARRERLTQPREPDLRLGRPQHGGQGALAFRIGGLVRREQHRRGGSRFADQVRTRSNVQPTAAQHQGHLADREDRGPRRRRGQHHQHADRLGRQQADHQQDAHLHRDGQPPPPRLPARSDHARETGASNR